MQVFVCSQSALFKYGHPGYSRWRCRVVSPHVGGSAAINFTLLPSIVELLNLDRFPNM